MTNKYDVQKEIVRKLTRQQVFLLSLLFLAVLIIVAVFAPTALMGIM